MSDTIYLVHGESGQYSDRTWWLVAWHADEATAGAHAQALREDAAKHAKKLQSLWDEDSDAAIAFRPQKPLDPHFAGGENKIDLDDATYYVTPVSRSKWTLPLPRRQS